MNNKKQQELYELIAQNELEQCFEALETIIEAEAPLLYVELIMLRRRHESLRDDQRSGTISHDDHRAEESKLARDLLYLIQQLPTDEETAPAAQTNNPRGKLLHDIPARFPLNRLTKCVIRIADTEAALLQNYQPGQDTIIEEVPIKKVMAVELIDIEDGENFDIKPLNSTAQKLVSGEASQWVYYVKALTPGEHLLVLRISTVEMIDGVERPKELLFERPVRVVAEAEPRSTHEERRWQPTQVTLSGAGGQVSPEPPKAAGASTTVTAPPKRSRPATEPPRPPVSQPAPAPAPAPVTSSSKTPWGKIVAALLLVVVAGWWILSINDENPTIVTEPLNPPVGIDDDTDQPVGTNITRAALVGTYRSPAGEEVQIAFGRFNMLYLSSEDYAEPRMMEVDGITFRANGLDGTFEFIPTGFGSVNGFFPLSDPEQIWLRVPE